MTAGRERTDRKPYLFTFWDGSEPMPAHIALCRETVLANLSGAFEIVPLDFSSALEWLQERDLLWRAAEPATTGRSYSREARQIALFTGMLRVGLLARHGGLWLDADHVVFPNFAFLTSLVTTRDIVAPEDADGRLSNPVLGARPGSPFAQSLWQELLSRINAKAAEGTSGTRWGEFGFRLLNRTWQKIPPETSFVAPFGTLISFDTSTPQNVFAPTSGQMTALSPLALGLSVFNNAVDGTVRACSAQALREADSLYGLAWRAAMGQAPELDAWLIIRDATHLEALDRSNLISARLAAEREHLDVIAALRGKLETRTAKVQRLTELVASLREQLRKRTV